MHPFVHLSIGFWLYTALQCRSSMSSNCLVFHTSGGISSSPAAFLFLIFLRTESSSPCVNGPSLMSNCLLIILVIGSCVIFGGFPSKFSKCCFHSFILSCWFVALSFALVVLPLYNLQWLICYKTQPTNQLFKEKTINVNFVLILSLIKSNYWIVFAFYYLNFCILC